MRSFLAPCMHLYYDERWYIAKGEKMKQKKIMILLGNYGSGKTEIAINFALQAAAQQKSVALIDLDIINPCFRSAEKKEMLETAGVRVICSPYANTSIDLPIVTAEVWSVFASDEELIIFDVGGDAVGATALGQYHQMFQEIENLECYFVVNIRRPLCQRAEQIESWISEIEQASRKTITALINNSNTGSESSVQDILDGQHVLMQVSSKLDIPIAYTVGEPDLLAEAAQKETLIGIQQPIQSYMKPAWL